MSGAQRLLKRSGEGAGGGLTGAGGQLRLRKKKTKHFLCPIWQKKSQKKKNSLAIVNAALVRREQGQCAWDLTLPNGYNEKYSMLIRVG